MKQLTQNEARELLDEYKRVTESRMDRIRAALHAGLSRTEIAERLGLHRSYVTDLIRQHGITDEAPE
jgi:DNA-binding MarR family transcriptional regulator